MCWGLVLTYTDFWSLPSCSCILNKTDQLTDEPETDFGTMAKNLCLLCWKSLFYLSEDCRLLVELMAITILFTERWITLGFPEASLDWKLIRQGSPHHAILCWHSTFQHHVIVNLIKPTLLCQASVDNFTRSSAIAFNSNRLCSLHYYPSIDVKRIQISSISTKGFLRFWLILDLSFHIIREPDDRNWVGVSSFVPFGNFLILHTRLSKS